MTGSGTRGPSGVVVALCTGHRCAALTRRGGDGVLISAPCLQQCARGAVGAVALRVDGAGTTGPSVWLGGLDGAGRLATLAGWVEEQRSGTGTELPEELAGCVLGYGPPVRLAASDG